MRQRLPMTKKDTVNWALTEEKLINWSFYDLAAAYQSVHINY